MGRIMQNCNDVAYLREQEVVMITSDDLLL